ncbi:hypothetical protein CVT26_013804 [Gymnopilus dilepis]|uniref:Ribonucleotide reductase large subunit C-terminal domain-containing protein n=1 Tax=Gymnopilus dilepis TaxID=231916 RepID=A0A409WSU8_9AGAR|nr:hypothetical protein CVT26_013804 [Gymnopilus dilepis]
MKTKINTALIIHELKKAAMPILPLKDIQKLAASLALKELYDETPATFEESFNLLQEADPPILSEAYINKTRDMISTGHIKGIIMPERDEELSHETIMTFRTHLLLRSKGRILERPNHAFMRLSIGIHLPDIDILDLLITYSQASTLQCLHSSTAIVNAGTICGQMIPSFSTSFRIGESEAANSTSAECYFILSRGGSVAVNLTNVPSSNANIEDYDGLVLAVETLHMTAKRAAEHCIRGAGKLTLVIEPWHAEIRVFIDAIKQTIRREGPLAFSLSVPDLLIRRAENGEDWSLFRPEDVPGLATSHGQEFEDLYLAYESQSLATAKYQAKQFWSMISVSIWETNYPAVTYKDVVNIHFINIASSRFDFDSLHGVAEILTTDLNRMMFANKHPTHSASEGATRHRAIAIGVIGLADVFTTLRLPFDSIDAIGLGSDIMQTIYHAALETSCRLVDTYGPHFTFTNSPASNGKLDFDHWTHPIDKSRFDWTGLAERIKEKGLCNSQVTALPDFNFHTKITCVSQGVQPRESNLIRKLSATHDYLAILPSLVEDLERLGIWSDDVVDDILEAEGSIRNLDFIPQHLKDLYKTAWEIAPEFIIQHAQYRAPFVSQSESLTLFEKNPTPSWIYSMLTFAKNSNLKTGLYTIRRQIKTPSKSTKFVMPKKSNS